MQQMQLILKKNKILPLTEKELKLHQDLTVSYICRKKFTQKFAKDKSYCKVRDHCHFTGKYNTWYLQFKTYCAQQNSCSSSQRSKLRVSFYQERINNQVQEPI